MHRKRPNLILIMTDQHRADALGCMGNGIIKTPNLDRVAERGTIFDNAFVQSPVCMASRAAIHTGRYPRAIRVPSMGLLPPTEITMAESLKRAGYNTGMFGKLHFTPQQFTLSKRGIDRPVFDAVFFLEEAGILSAATQAAVDDPAKKNYGFDVCVGVEDFLWGNYLAWLSGLSPGHLKYFLAENMGCSAIAGQYNVKPTTTPVFSSYMRGLYDSRIPAELHPSRFIVEKTVEFIKSNRDVPFFAHCSFVDPHQPYNAPTPYNRMYPPDEMPVPSELNLQDCYPPGLPSGVQTQIDEYIRFPTKLWQWALANYYGMISNIDDSLGRLFGELKDMDLLENTIVVFVADHGEYVGDHRLLRKGSLLFDALMRVPFFVTWPGEIEGGRRIVSMVQGIDIYPTVMSLLGLPIHPGVQGKDLAGMLRGGDVVGYERVYCELDELTNPIYANPIYMPSQAVRSESWKLNYFPLARVGLLYDLEEDPEERQNRYFDPAYAAVKGELMMDLLDHHYESKDPLPIRLSQA
jgi:arylsulfatase A-like enzyme